MGVLCRDAFDQSVSPVPEFFNDEVKNNTSLGNITIQSSPAAGDLDGDGLPEIIVGVGGFVDPGTGGVGGRQPAMARSDRVESLSSVTKENSNFLFEAGIPLMA